MARRSISIDEKIEMKKDKINKLQDKLNVALDELNVLLEKKKAEKRKAINDAIDASSKSMEEILEFLKGTDSE